MELDLLVEGAAGELLKYAKMPVIAAAIITLMAPISAAITAGLRLDGLRLDGLAGMECPLSAGSNLRSIPKQSARQKPMTFHCTFKTFAC
jgi:hypothetical protein